jgi:hypothetical protein
MLSSLRRLLRWLREEGGGHLETLTEAQAEANARPERRVIEPLPMDRPDDHSAL